MRAAVAPPAGFNFTMQLSMRQLNKITVLVEFVIYGGLRTPWVYRSSYALIVRFYRNQRVCLCTHTLVFLTASGQLIGHLFLQDLYPLQHQKSRKHRPKSGQCFG